MRSRQFNHDDLGYFRAIAYYLGHRVEIDSYLQQAETEFAALQQATYEIDRPFYEKLMQVRRSQMQIWRTG